jgi:predicted metal-binding membrane protein
MVVEGFQTSLSKAVGIRESLENTSRMLQRVGTVISARLSKLQAGDREKAERRDRLVAILVAIASLLALPPALLLAFFGINSPNIHPGDSIFDLHVYWGAYVLAWLPFILLVSIGGFLYSRLRRRVSALDTLNQ